MTYSFFNRIFLEKKPIIAMIHVFFLDKMQSQMNQALEDLERLQPFVDGVIVENYGWGYQNNNNATSKAEEILTDITKVVVANSSIPVGLNVLPNDYEKSFRIAEATGGRFIQMDHITGRFIDCEPVDEVHFLQIRKQYPEIAVFGGIYPKYYDPIDPEVKLTEAAQKAKDLVDAVVVTGDKTGGETNLDDLLEVRKAIGVFPLIIGSGFNADNAYDQLTIADGAIVGTAFKKKGVRPGEPIDSGMVEELILEVRALRVEIEYPNRDW